MDAGKKLFDKGPCHDCHSRDATTTDDEGPNLGGRGSRPWLEAFIATPDHPRFFGPKNEMDVFKDKLSPAEIAQVAAFIAGAAGRGEVVGYPRRRRATLISAGTVDGKLSGGQPARFKRSAVSLHACYPSAEQSTTSVCIRRLE